MLSCSEILGPFIFVEQAVTWMTFLDMLRMYLLSHLKSHQLNVFQQYGGPPYRVRSIRNFFTWHFPERQFGRDGLIPWPPHSPDVASFDFFLWWCVEDIVNKIPVTSLDELKLKIVAAINLNRKMPDSTQRELKYRLDILHATKVAHAQVVQHSALLIIQC